MCKETNMLQWINASLLETNTKQVELTGWSHSSSDHIRTVDKLTVIILLCS